MPPQMGPKPDASQYPTQNHMASANYPPNMAGKHPTMGPHFSQGGQYFPRPGTPNGSQYGPQGMVSAILTTNKYKCLETCYHTQKFTLYGIMVYFIQA